MIPYLVNVNNENIGSEFLNILIYFKNILISSFPWITTYFPYLAQVTMLNHLNSPPSMFLLLLVSSPCSLNDFCRFSRLSNFVDAVSLFHDFPHEWILSFLVGYSSHRFIFGLLDDQTVGPWGIIVLISHIHCKIKPQELVVFSHWWWRFHW